VAIAVALITQASGRLRVVPDNRLINRQKTNKVHCKLEITVMEALEFFNSPLEFPTSYIETTRTDLEEHWKRRELKIKLNYAIFSKKIKG
jgi:hypothetical protein